MDAVEFIKERNRMCNSMKSCSQCLFDEMQYCDFDTENPEKLVAFVKKWSQEHPKKTMMQDFFEKYPNAPKNVDGCSPILCPYQCGYEKQRYCIEVNRDVRECRQCWSRPVL